MPSTGAEPPVPGAPAAPGDGPPLFLVPTDLADGEVITLTGREGRHAATVRRLAVGERADVTDGAGLIAACLVTATRAGTIELAVQARRVLPRPDPSLTVAQALPKGDRGQLAVESLTEAGADTIVAWQAARCVTQWREDRAGRGLDRWRATAREAAKQSRRGWLPEVTGPETTSGLAERVAGAALAVLLDPAGDVPLADVAVPGTGEMLVIVGPEGGVTPTETGLLADAGAVRARLGPTVLRTSSAGLAAAAVLLSRSGRWHGQPA